MSSEATTSTQRTPPSPGRAGLVASPLSMGQTLPISPGKCRRVVATDCVPAALPAGCPAFYILLACLEFGPVACLIVWMTL